MSVWSSFEGTISMRTGCGCSVLQAAKEWFDEAVVRVEQTNKNHSTTTFKIEISFCQDGECAGHLIQGFIDLLKSYDRSCRADLQANIRFVG